MTLRPKRPLVPSSAGTQQHGRVGPATRFVPPAPPPPGSKVAATPGVPRAVSMAQARLVLVETPSPTNAGKTMLDDVNAVVAASTDSSMIVWWEYSPYVYRNNERVVTIAAALNPPLSPAQVDALFIAASLLVP